MSRLALPTVLLYGRGLPCGRWTVQGDGSVPVICSSERLLGRAVFQEPSWSGGHLDLILGLLRPHQVTTVRHSPYRPAPRGLGETSGEILPEDTGTEDEDASNAGKGEVDQGLSAIILCDVIEIGLFNELLPVDDENVEDNF